MRRPKVLMSSFVLSCLIVLSFIFNSHSTVTISNFPFVLPFELIGEKDLKFVTNREGYSSIELLGKEQKNLRKDSDLLKQLFPFSE